MGYKAMPLSVRGVPAHSTRVEIAGQWPLGVVSLDRSEEDPSVWSKTVRVLPGVYYLRVHVTPAPPPSSSATVRGGLITWRVGHVANAAGENIHPFDEIPERDYRRGRWPADEGFRVVELDAGPEVPPRAEALGVLPRRLFILLPPSYAINEERRFPVLYALDGGSVFSTTREEGRHCGLPNGGWWLDKAADGLFRTGAAEEFILVAVPHAGVNRERECGETDGLLSYITEGIKPFIDGSLRTRPDPASTAILGSSFSGLFALRAAIRVPHIFGVAAGMSPALWLEDEIKGTFEAELRAAVASGTVSPRTTRLYLDAGDGAGDNSEYVVSVARALVELGWDDRGPDAELLRVAAPSEMWVCKCSLENEAGAFQCAACGDAAVPLPPLNQLSNGDGWVAQGEEQGSLLYVFARIAHLVRDGFTHSEDVWAHRVHRPLRFMFRV